MEAAKPEQGAGKLEQRQEIGRPFVVPVVPDEQRAALEEPGVGALDSPAAGGEARLARGELLLADAAQLRDVVVARHGLGLGLGAGVVAQVQTQLLGPLTRGDGARDDEGIARQRRAGWCPARSPQRSPLPAGRRPPRPAGSASPHVCRDRAECARPPKRALPLMASAACHSQSTPPHSAPAATRVAHRRAKSPSWTQRWKGRCTALSSGKRAGSWHQWRPVRRRKRIASRVRRASTRGRPVLLGGSTSASSGAMTSHPSSEIVQIVAMAFPSARTWRGRPIAPLLPSRSSFPQSTAAQTLLR